MAAPTVLGATYAGYESGWQVLFDHKAGFGTKRVRIMQGPAKSLDAQIAVIQALYDCITLEPSVSPGSAVATLRITYGSSGTTVPVGELRQPVYALTPMRISVDLKARPILGATASLLPQIDAAIARGDIAKVEELVDGNELATRYARLAIAGVTSYEMTGFVLSVTRYYADAPSISSDYAEIGQVFAWSSISTDGKSIPASVEEPKYLLPSGSATGYEWRLVGVAPVVAKDTENVVSWTYEGLQQWAKWLYKGGSWEPAAL